MKKIDILITHKDRNNYLYELYNLLMNERFIDDFRIVVQDDDSKIIPGIATVHGKFGSSAKAKKNIAQFIESDYFIFIDSDDLIKPGFCKNILDHYDRNVTTSFLFENEDHVISSRYYVKDIHSMIRLCSFRYPCVVCSNSYHVIGGIDSSLNVCADIDLYWRLFSEFADQITSIYIPIMIKRNLRDSVSFFNKRIQDDTFRKLSKKYLFINGFN